MVNVDVSFQMSRLKEACDDRSGFRLAFRLTTPGLTFSGTGCSAEFFSFFWSLFAVSVNTDLDFGIF